MGGFLVAVEAVEAAAAALSYFCVIFSQFQISVFFIVELKQIYVNEQISISASSLLLR